MANSHRLIYPVDLSDCAANLELISSRLGVSKAVAIREAIKTYAERVRGLKVVELREVSGKQAEKEVLVYLRKRGKAYTSEIADELRIDVELVNDLLVKLAERGAVK